MPISADMIDDIKKELRVAYEEALLPHSEALFSRVGLCNFVSEKINNLTVENAAKTADELARLAKGLQTMMKDIPDGDTVRDALESLMDLHAHIAKETADDLKKAL